VIVAVGTGGVSAGLAKALRLRLEQLLPQSLGALALALGAARTALRARWPDGAERRRGIDAGLRSGGPLDPLANYAPGAVDDWLQAAQAATGSVNEFTLTSEDPDDLTLRQARWLGSADQVLHEAGVPAAVLNRARADAVRQVLGAELPAAAPGRCTVIIRRG
jgi:uroporphyrin-III C-methyltransferase/precorrin-2 dehydrogenase/sirohydrochlorin ferrochelatase